jgi:protein TonB
MAPILNDTETPVVATTPSVPAAPPTKSLTEALTRPQPVALEIPITVNGARTVDGSDKREPFSETTATVLVFPQGAVIRISTPLVPGQLIFLTNEKSKKEIVCQVVKSKAAGSASAYVELKFTEPATGFWGLLAPAFSSSPVAPRPATPVAPAAPKATLSAPLLATQQVAPKPVTPAAISTPPAKPIASPPPPAPILEFPAPQSVAPSNPAPPIFVPPPPPVAAAPEPPPARTIAPVDVAPQIHAAPEPPSPPFDYSKEIDALFAVPATPASSSPSSEELKLQAAGLQEKLGSLLFTKTPAPLASSTPTVTAETESTVAKVKKSPLETSMDEPKPILHSEPSAYPPFRKQTLVPLTADEEEVKIPAWLAPSAQDSDSSATDHAAFGDGSSDSGLSLDSEGSSDAAFADGHRRPQTAVFGGQLLGESSAQTEKSSSTGSKKGLFFGLAAAAVLLSAGGAWYYQQNYAGASPSSSFVHAGVPSSTASAPLSVPPAAKTVNVPPAVVSPASALPSKTPPPVPAQPVSAGAPEPRNSKPVPDTTPVESPNKSVLGDVHLATPVVSHAAVSQQVGDALPAIDSNASSAGADPLAAAAHGKEPSAPLPVGGDVKPAQLIKSVPPVYPQFAKAQHIFGNVQIDALIDASGNVAGMQVISGPPVLHRAALDAVKQWKYSPALLNGQPTSMHLSVTVQFRSE